MEEKRDYLRRELEKVQLLRENEEGMEQEHRSLADADGDEWQGQAKGIEQYEIFLYTAVVRMSRFHLAVCPLSLGAARSTFAK